MDKEQIRKEINERTIEMYNQKLKRMSQIEVFFFEIENIIEAGQSLDYSTIVELKQITQFFIDIIRYTIANKNEKLADRIKSLNINPLYKITLNTVNKPNKDKSIQVNYIGTNYINTNTSSEIINTILTEAKEVFKWSIVEIKQTDFSTKNDVLYEGVIDLLANAQSEKGTESDIKNTKDLDEEEIIDSSIDNKQENITEPKPINNDDKEIHRFDIQDNHKIIEIYEFCTKENDSIFSKTNIPLREFLLYIENANFSLIYNDTIAKKTKQRYLIFILSKIMGQDWYEKTAFSIHTSKDKCSGASVPPLWKAKINKKVDPLERRT